MIKLIVIYCLVVVIMLGFFHGAHKKW